MVVFGTPDFGATAFVILFWLVVWIIILSLSLVGAVCATVWLHKGTAKSKRYGLILILTCACVPLTCWLGPPHAVRLVFGNYPIGRYPSPSEITRGMTSEDVLTKLGKPHEYYKDAEGESWFYWLDSYGIMWFGVYFYADGTVKGTSFN